MAHPLVSGFRARLETLPCPTHEIGILLVFLVTEVFIILKACRRNTLYASSKPLTCTFLGHIGELDLTRNIIPYPFELQILLLSTPKLLANLFLSTY